jgi:hypothetical protein
MKCTQLFLLSILVVASCGLISGQADAQTDVVAFWGFADNYDFDDGADGPNKQDFAADVDNTLGTANLQMYLGAADELDDNGGGGFTSYTSSASGLAYGPSRTIKWDDQRGGGDDFDIAGTTVFNVAKGGDPVETDDFGNDALLYLTFDGTGFQDFEMRFDVEATPFDPDPDPGTVAEPFLPESFDVFYRTTGAGGTWLRDTDQNNIALSFFDQDPGNPDPENQVAVAGFVGLSSLLNNSSQIEIIISDFANGNGEMEIDNFEIVANVSAVPEPASTSLLLMASVGLLGLRRRSRG